jgi:hypothetical protein
VRGRRSGRALLIRTLIKLGPWRGAKEAALYNERRLHTSIGYQTPTESRVVRQQWMSTAAQGEGVN